MADWGNDDQPYAMHTDPPLLSIPNQAEWDDVQLISHRKVSSRDLARQVLDAFGRLHPDGVLRPFFGLHLHPWLIGQPHRIATLEAIVDKIAAASGVWRTTAGGIADHVAQR